jgi:serine/threonine protein kinase
MVMELAENGTLFNYQNKQQRLTEAEAFKFFSQSLSAIKYMHQHDRMHRDIKVRVLTFSPKTSSWIAPITSRSAIWAGLLTTST